MSDFYGICLCLLTCCWILNVVDSLAAGGIKTRPFVMPPHVAGEKPKLILISGCPGTGKSTFGMSIALDQGILKCISTDTVRAVMRSYVPKDISPALHRSSYAIANDSDDPIKSWMETCQVLSSSLEGLVDDAIARGVGLVLEGVSILPSKKWIQKWEDAGGIACGCLLTVPEEKSHKSLLLKRGFMTGKGGQEQKKIKSFDRVRIIQDEMIRLAKEADWILIEQRIQADPLEVVAAKLYMDEYNNVGLNGDCNMSELVDDETQQPSTTPST